MESLQESIQERSKHKREHDKRMNDRMMQSKEGKVDSSKALDVGLVVTESNETESERHVSSSRSRNDTHAEDVDIKPVNDNEPMAENAVKCQVSCLLLDSSFDNMTTEFSNQFLESENISLKKIVAQLQKDFSRMEAHCVNMELKYQNQALKKGQHGQILNETSNKAKIKKEIEVLETINIELEHSVAKLLAENEKLNKENEHLKQTYKDLYDSIKKTRVQTKDHNDSLIAQINSKTIENVDLKAQIQDKVAGTRYEVLYTSVPGTVHVSTRYCSGGGWTNQMVTRGTGVCQSKPICEKYGGYHMDYQCTQAEEIERQREYERLEIEREKSMQEFTDTFKEFLERMNIQRKEEEKRIFEEAARQEEEKRIAKEKEAAELEGITVISQCVLKYREKIYPQDSIRSRKSQIDRL
ncbi:hypothetical protein Tco_0787653 [Tanacetum coccineum]